MKIEKISPKKLFLHTHLADCEVEGLKKKVNISMSVNGSVLFFDFGSMDDRYSVSLEEIFKAVLEFRSKEPK